MDLCYSSKKVQEKQASKTVQESTAEGNTKTKAEQRGTAITCNPSFYRNSQALGASPSARGLASTFDLESLQLCLGACELEILVGRLPQRRNIKLETGSHLCLMK
jgi:hypothetical protein